MDSKLDKFLQEFAEYVIYGEEKLKEAYKKQKISNDNSKVNLKELYHNFNQIYITNQWKIKQEEIFYRQAKFLENFEDDYEPEFGYIEEYRFYAHTYGFISFKDFRAYFSWRTKIRKGIYEKANWNYEMAYISELVNKIGCKDASDALNKLIEFWTQYRNTGKRIDDKMLEVIKEFYIANKINIEFSEIVKEFPIVIENFEEDVRDILNSKYNNKIEMLNSISSYKISKSTLLKTEYGYLLNECLQKNLSKLHEEFAKINIDLPEMLICKEDFGFWWKPLSSYNLFDYDTTERKIEISDIEKYEYKDGAFSKKAYYTRTIYRHTIGYILKTIECYVRDYIGFRSLKLETQNTIFKDIYDFCPSEAKKTLKKINKLNLQNIIQTETIQFLESKRIPKNIVKKKKEKKDEFEEEEKIEIVFNKEQFDNIRQKADKIRDVLIVEEEQEIQEQEQKEEKIVQKQEFKNTFEAFASCLTQTEKEIIQAILQKQDVENKILQIAQKQNEMLEVVISKINDKALETIGDTIIDGNSIYDDYENDIKQVLGKEE